VQVTFDEARGEAVYTLTTAQADEGEGSHTIKLRNVKGQAGVEEGSAVDDLIVLTHLHEPSILYTLEERYNEDIIYTYTGPILLAINPFWRVPLYSNKILEQYRRDGQSKMYDPDFQSVLPPHVYATADNAYRQMTNPASAHHKRNQSILVSGESGNNCHHINNF
jgi:myosin V